jgi:hypothetical protein
MVHKSDASLRAPAASSESESQTFVFTTFAILIIAATGTCSKLLKKMTTTGGAITHMTATMSQIQRQSSA